jgi:ABC-type multidrug transport system fused ATPase/permease subunit
LRPWLAARVCLVVSHRLSTVEWADRIVVLAGGSVAESGSHDELYQRRGAYYRLRAARSDGEDAASQAGAATPDPERDGAV